MSEGGRHGLSDQYPRASPWPVFVAFGLTLAELGVLFGSPAVSVGGIVLLAASVVGIVRESGYAASLWGPGVVIGGVFAALGGTVLAFTGAQFRGTYILAGGGIVLAGAAVLYLVESGRL